MEYNDKYMKSFKNISGGIFFRLFSYFFFFLNLERILSSFRGFLCFFVLHCILKLFPPHGLCGFIWKELNM